MVLTYDPKQVAAIFKGNIIHGFADSTFIQVERNEDAYALKVGVDGEGTRAKSNNKSGKITFTLMMSSDSNDALSAAAAADELNGTGTGSLLINDKSGRTKAAAATAWIKKLPNAEFAKEANTRVWVLETDELDLFLGGN